MFRATIFTLMPDMFPGPLGASLSGDALARGLWSLEARNIRDHGIGRIARWTTRRRVAVRAWSSAPTFWRRASTPGWRRTTPAPGC